MEGIRKMTPDVSDKVPFEAISKVSLLVDKKFLHSLQRILDIWRNIEVFQFFFFTALEDPLMCSMADFCHFLPLENEKVKGESGWY